MKIATWNVNGIRARQTQQEERVAVERPDDVCLQEIKATADQMTDATVNASASLLCQEFYLNAPDSKERLVAFRALDTYRISQDTGLAAASEQAIKRFADAKILPEPSSYRVKNDCGEQLHKPKASAAMLK